MLPNDVFQNRLAEVRARLEGWCDARTAFAWIDKEHGRGFWRIAARPMARYACPVETVAHTESQTFDLRIGEESHSGLGVEMLDPLVDLFAGAEAGSVVTRAWFSTDTGEPCAIDTLVPLPGGPTWMRRRLIGRRSPDFEQHAAARDRRYVPWRRSSA